MKFHSAICSVLLAGLIGCASNDTTAEGPGSETSGLTALLLDSNGAPLSGIGIRVVAIDGSWRKALADDTPPVLARGLTNSSGRIHFELHDSGKVALEIEAPSLAGRLEAATGSDSTWTMHPSTGRRLEISASVEGERISRLLLAGTGYEAVSTLRGTWLFEGVPDGSYTAVAVTDSGIALLGRLTLRGMDIDTSLAADHDSVVVEDFAASPVRNRYGNLLGGGWWYTVTDGSSSTSPALPRDAISPCVDGNCLSMDFAIDLSRVERYALIGFDLDGSREPGDTTSRLADLSKITEVRFRALGWGSMLFQLAVRTPGGNFTACRTSFTPPSTMSTVQIPLASMSCDSSNADLHQVFGMTWTAVNNAHLTLGRVSLVGAGPRAVFLGLGRR